MKKIYYYLEMKQTSPLRIGTGAGEETDNDLRTDGRGVPYIPGSSLAGVLRSGLSEEDAKRLFGDIDVEKQMNSKVNISIPSKLIISSADMKPDVNEKNVIIGIRDGVGLNDWGMTINKAKYDFQVVETDESYYAVIEWTGNEKDEEEEIKRVFEPYLQRIIKQGISFGARTSRGYGAMTVSIRKLEFKFPEELSLWLRSCPMRDRFNHVGTLLEGAEDTAKKYTNMEIAFEVLDSFNIRVNTSRAEALEDGTVPDSIPLLNAKKTPIIPGTAWAGTFRHHMHRLIRESGMRGNALSKRIDNLDYECFGMSHEKNKNHMRSGITFLETDIIGGCANNIVRNAVDRFTAAPKNTGLFTNQVWVGGEGVLRIQVKSSISDCNKELLKSVLFDMGLGLLTIGGDAGIGRGRLGIKKIEIDGVDITTQIIPEEYVVK